MWGLSKSVVALLASVTAGLVTTVGVLAISRHAILARRYAHYFIGFAAGVLGTVALIHLLPHSLTMVDYAPQLWLVGFLLLYFSDHFVERYVLESASKRWGIVSMLGIGYHSLIDGVIYMVTFNVSIFTGLLAAVGMILHEFPEGVVTFALLTEGGFDRRRAALYTLLAAALSTPLGALAAYPFVWSIDRRTLGALLALAGGGLLFVGTTHLLPKLTKDQNHRAGSVALLVGVLVGWLIVRLGH
jgi:zinc transporter ZupT